MIRPFHKPDFTQLITIETLTQISPWTRETFESCWELNYPCWVLEEDYIIRGFIMVSYQAGECHILNIGVHPDYQRKGFGLTLMEYALSKAKEKNMTMALLEVRRSNKKAIKLYDKLGFIQIGERKNYYPAQKGQEDALVFAKDLGVQ